jgi:transposase
MLCLKKGQNFKFRVALEISDKIDFHQYEVSFRRWLAREIYEGRMSASEAVTDLGLSYVAVKNIVKVYEPSVAVTLPVMTEAEKLEVQKLEESLKKLKKELEDARIKNIALETLIDVAESELKIPIRKKPGAKQ